MTINIPPIKHVTFEQPGDAQVMKIITGALPALKQGLVTIKVHAAGVNGPDIKQRQGAYPAPEGASPILGLEVAGEVIAVAEDVTQWQVGDHVCALVPGGGYAQFVNTFAEHCLPVPTGWSFIQAAALPETFFTVWGNVFMRAKLTAGETILIHGASGGIGSTAVQLAHHLGAKVLATTSSADKAEYCLGLGAAHVINYNEQCFVEPILALTHNKGVDVVLDMAGGEFINKNIKVMAMDGRMVSIAMQRGLKATVDIFRIMTKRLTWTGSTLRPQSVAAKAEIAAQLHQHVWPLLSSGVIQIPIDKVFPLSEVVSAHQYMESGAHKGKIVLSVE
ncbi:NAD(P)H-quinone oxidoreductase [Shewanella gaetbuli]